VIRGLKIVLFVVLLAASGAIALYAAGRAPSSAVTDSSKIVQNGKIQLVAQALASQAGQPALETSQSRTGERLCW
jgi:hypothetical protein